MNWWIGCERLAEIEENTVLTFSESDWDGDQRLIMKCSKARRVGLCFPTGILATHLDSQACRRGNMEHGISVLLDPDTWQELTLVNIIHGATRCGRLCGYTLHAGFETPLE